MFTQFTGQSKPRNINLGNAPSESSSSVLARARAERQARERVRLEQQAAQTIQRVWRGRRCAAEVIDQLLVELETDGDLNDVGEIVIRCRALLVVTWKGVGGYRRKEKALQIDRWSALVATASAAGPSVALNPLLNNPQFSTTLGALACRVLEEIASTDIPPEVACAKALEKLLDRKTYEFLTDGDVIFRSIVERLLQARWVESLTAGLESIPPPKKKHPSVSTLVKLLTLPCDIYSQSPIVPQHIIPAYLHTLLAFPSLPSIMPLQSLTHFCSHLPLFSDIFSHCLAHPEVLQTGALTTERGKTELLANLVTLVVRGGMLARQSKEGVLKWLQVVSVLLGGMDEQWGLWLEGKGQWRDRSAEAVISGRQGQLAISADSDEDMEVASNSRQLTSTSSRVRERGTIPPALATKIIPLIETGHLITLKKWALRDEAMILPFVDFIYSLLSAFRGSPRWEMILDAVLEGETGTRLVRQLWRGHVRGRWSRNAVKENWENMFAVKQSRSTALPVETGPFLLLSTLYIHHLLTIPDDEFFSPPSMTQNALTLDEVIDLAGIWRDLAFYGYWRGVSASSWCKTEQERKAEERKREEVRGLMTRGVTAVRARDARRPFTQANFWIMTSEFDLKSFVGAVELEEQQLDAPDPEEDVDMSDPVAAASARPPPWMRGRKNISKRQMAFISPRLGLLNNLPMTIPFETRVEILQRFILNDRERLGIDRYMRRIGTQHQATIRRGHISEDGFKELDKLGPMLKGTVQVRFIDEWGQEEAGIDGGGLFKEFLTALSKEVFDTDRGLWLSTSQNELYPNPHSYAKEQHQLNWYTFIGRVLGKAMYEGILVDVSFAGFFLAKWLGKQSFLDDLVSLDVELYKGLILLKNYPGDPEDLSLNFTIAEQEFGVTNSIDLVPNGSNIAVTRANRMEYIQLVCDYKLNRQIAPQCEAFFSGLSDIIDPKWLRMFDQQELQTLVGGTEAPIDVDDLQRNSVMPDHDNDITIRLFWKVVSTFNQTQLKALLKFVTSCARPPLLGFSNLNPRFGIRLSGNDTTRLPSASACFNLLKLPNYKDEYTLRAKLLQAIFSGAGFDLS